MSATDIMLERETANDESALVVAIHVVSGATVQKDAVIFDIENSKATQEVLAPETGILTHALAVGQTVDFGVPIARLLPAAMASTPGVAPAVAAPTVAAPTVAAVEPVSRPESLTQLISQVEAAPRQREAEAPPRRPNTTTRFSHAALALLAEYGLGAEQFTGDFITASEVLTRVGRPSPVRAPVPAPILAPIPSPSTTTGRGGAGSSVVGPGQPVSRSKKVEIDTLSKGAGATMLSVLGTSIGPVAVAREAGDFLAGTITDLVIYEASRLVRKYPRLNAAYVDGQIFQHAAVHAGLAIDDGGRLVVYGIQNADQASLHDLSGIIADAAARYATGDLTGAEMSRATFTVTDLSADELDFVFPLLPRGQSCILGITRSAQSGFRIHAGFDHRVTEGREVGAFLGELRTRLLSFGNIARATGASATATGGGDGTHEAAAAECGFCGRTLAEAVGKGQDKGLLKIVDRKGQNALCCASCWNGW